MIIDSKILLKMTSIGDSREVGWFSWMEWAHVRKLLYSFNDSKSQIKGINMVNIWRSRLSHRGIPVSVDLTAALVSAYIGNTTSIYGNEYQAQMSSAMAIVRFVNGVTDQHQTGIYAQSVQEIADKINIPDWMVDLRHEATHAKLPGFDILKRGLIIALNWLDSNYWEETATKLIEKEQMLSINLNRDIGDYVTTVIDVLVYDMKSNRSAKEKTKTKQKKFEQCQEISHNLHRYIHNGNLKTFVNIFLQEGLFVLNQSQIQLLDITIVSCEYNLDQTSINKLSDFSYLWKPMLDMFQEVYPLFLELVTTAIINLAKKYQDSKLYVNYLVAMFVLFKCNNSSEMVLTRYLLKNPSHLGFQILKVIIEEGQRTIAMKENVVSFLDIFKPVISALNRKSSTFDATKLDMMRTEASERGKEIIYKLKEAETTKLTQSYDFTKSWFAVSDISMLPPMGEFTCNENLFNLDMDNCSNAVPFANDICDNAITFTEKEDDNLKKRIDNLFMDNFVYVGDNDVSSSSTDEYGYDDETAWDEDVDFNIDDKDSIKLGLGYNFFLHHPKNLKDCDSTKIRFF